MTTRRSNAMTGSRAGWLLAPLSFALTIAAQDVAAASLDEQRAAFIDVYPSAELGNWDPVEERETILRDYVLWPDLEAAYLRSNLDNSSAVESFVGRYGNLRPAREILYRYARRLGRQGNHSGYLEIYDRHFAESGDAVLDCMAADARIATDQAADGFALGRRLWLTGHSQVNECDPVFAAMRSNGELTGSLLTERYDLAVDAGDYLLARYIARSIGDDKLAEANRWLRANGDPSTFLKRADSGLDDAVYREQLAHAVRRLAVSDPERAFEEWSGLQQDINFDDSVEQSVTRSIALWSARRDVDNAEDLLARLPDAAVDDDVRHWIIRHALRDGNWHTIAETTGNLAPENRNREEWRYWRAVALDATGAGAEAMLIYSTLARERSYYGFLAADELNVGYTIRTEDIEADEAVIQRLSTEPAFVRARELFITGLDGRARSEWDDAVAGLSDDERTQAVLLAERWNWPSRAIALAAKTGRYDSLAVRYPLPHREEFQASAELTGIPVSWAYGIARSESIFMRDIRSSAGAIGLMQLMPATGRRTAEEIRLPFNGLITLTDPASNIRLGSTYLAKMRDRFGGHPALATAAYNAGPHRVSRWLPDDSTGPVDARVWIETIPFRETRGYVRRVLTADVIFEWRLHGEARRLSDRLMAVLPEGALRTASN